MTSTVRLKLASHVSRESFQREQRGIPVANCQNARGSGSFDENLLPLRLVFGFLLSLFRRMLRAFGRAFGL